MRLCLLPEWCVIQPFARVPPSIIATFWIGSHTLERLAKPKLEQDTRSISRDLKASPYLSERSRLFKQLHVNAALPQRQGRGDAADAAANDKNFQASH